MGDRHNSVLLRDALADLPSLAELDLSRNKLIADAMEGHIFDLPRLEALNLSSNKLSRLNRKGLFTYDLCREGGIP